METKVDIPKYNPTNHFYFNMHIINTTNVNTIQMFLPELSCPRNIHVTHC